MPPPLTGPPGDPSPYFEWVYEKLMHNPGAKELESLLPVNWLKARIEPAVDIHATHIA
ncbi:MAG: hypothetical protein V4733_11420 [Verrucomicrobiota bacterium]